MNKQILSLITLTLTLGACSNANFEAVDLREPKVAEEEIEQEDNSTSVSNSTSEKEEQDVSSEDVYIVVDVSQGSLDLPGADLVDVIPEMELEIYEVESDHVLEELEQIQSDEELEMSVEETLSTQSELWQNLMSEPSLLMGVVGAVPEELQQLCEATGSKVLVFQGRDSSLYETEMIQGIFEAVKSEVDYLLVPIEKEEVSRMINEAIQIAQAEGLQVFDVTGEQF